jgi:hypothetical protein
MLGWSETAKLRPRFHGGFILSTLGSRRRSTDDMAAVEAMLVERFLDLDVLRP